MKTAQILMMLFFCLGFSNLQAQIDVDQKINKGLNSVGNGVKGLFNKKKPTPPAPQKVVKDTSKVQTQKSEPGASKPSTATPLAAYSKYDFVPGDKVIFYEDFSQDAVGDFPALWTTDVAGEVNTLNITPGNWFNLNSGEGSYWFMNNIDFPNNFIMEFDIVPKKGGARYAADLVLFGETSYSEMDKNSDPGNCGIHVAIAKSDWATAGYKNSTSVKLTGSSQVNLVQEEKVNHVILWIQNRRLRIYHQGGNVLDIPTNIYEGNKFNRMCFKLYRGASCASYISNIKITNAAPDTRYKLLTEGKLVTYGINFDVNKDVVKPESYGTLKEIAKVLTENPGVRVKIIGHTDGDGADAANLDLSKRRGASVKNELVKSFGIDASRLESDGMGKSQPVAPNDSPVNKALNRRVEFIKL